MKRMFACLIIVAILPLLASLPHNKSAQPAPFATVAFAGHTTPGGEYCTCGAPGCTCDPGEHPRGTNGATPEDKDNPPSHANTDIDLSSAALILALILLLLARLRT